jgi:lysophospholipase L1-like esterase
MNYLWQTNRIEAEPVTFVGEHGTPAAASLLMPATRIERISDAAGQIVYKPGTDYDLTPDGQVLRPAGSTMPLITPAQLYPPPESKHAYPKHVTRDCWMMHDEAGLWHRSQPRVTYTHHRWDGPTPAGQAANLPGTHAKLRQGGPLRVALFGDSISAGYNASSHMDLPPHEPDWGTRVVQRLRERYKADLVYHNESVGGQATPWAVQEIGRVTRHEPDLAILAWGMNDASGRRDPATYRQLIEQQMDALRQANAEVEFVLVATMLGNPDWLHAAPDLYPAYRDELAKLVSPGVALADVTTFWTWMCSRKKWIDMTGNGVNHPNDFGMRVYADVVMGAICV